MHFDWNPGKNCWKVEEATRLSILIDGEAYYRAIHEALTRARHSIFILAWDIHSELSLIRGDDAESIEDDWPAELGPLLNTLVERRKELNVYILNWDFAMIYALEREMFPSHKLEWKSRDRIQFQLDGEHPIGASHHQKIVLVDDEIAFVGGFDLSKWRWDTREHAPENALRRCPDNKPYPPFHDIQLLVQGPIVRTVSELARQRWHNATGEDAVPENPDTSKQSPWPPSAKVLAETLPIAIARTLPEYGEQHNIREVEQLYLDSIAAAERFIYIENQYFSSEVIGKAIATRLREENGPEVILVMPESTGGWLEQHTMDVLRTRLMRMLQDADKHQRLRLYGVRLSQNPDLWLMVHAKVMVIDDVFVRVGSSNLSNRSMGLDTECDLAFMCPSEGAAAELARNFRRSLLSEHLGVTVEEVAGAEESHDSLIKAVESLRDGERTLMPLSSDIPDTVDSLVPEADIIDPEKPLEPEEFFERVVRPAEPKTILQRYARIISLIGGVVALALAWRFTGLSDWLSVENAEAIATRIKEAPFTPVLVLLAYIIGGLLVLPITLMIVATVAVFGTWAGMGYALAGAELSAIVTYAIGHFLGRDTVGRIAGSRVNRLMRAMAKRGMLTIITLRIVPVAPFTVINVVAGVSPIRFRDFALGNFLGIIPGIAGIALMVDQILASLKNPDPATLAIAAIVIAGVSALLYGLRHGIQKLRAEAG
ncbi:MAG: VTT domain-containing protein [Ketobacteraceae bacterium]|nr:VTT domain-containing protein [Ketobacteraceae bacterium]